MGKKVEVGADTMWGELERVVRGIEPMVISEKKNGILLP